MFKNNYDCALAVAALKTQQEKKNCINLAGREIWIPILNAWN